MVRKLWSDKLYLSLIGVVVVFVVCVVYIFSGVLDAPLTRTPPKVHVELAATGGLYKGSAATYRGVKIGKVTNVTLNKDDTVDATVSLDAGVKIPVATKAAVRSLSPIGEQYLDFQPEKDGAPYLQNGSKVAATATSIPDSLGSTVVAVSNVLKQIDPVKLHSVLGDFATGLSGTGQQIGQIVDQGELVLADLEKVEPQTIDLLQKGGTAMDIPLSESNQLTSFAANLNTFSQFLKSYDPTLLKELKKWPGQLQTMQQLIDEWSKVLPGFFPVFNQFAEIFTSYDGQFRATLQQYAPGLNTVAQVLSGGSLHFHLLTQKDTRCEYAVGHNAPKTGARTPAGSYSGCPASAPNLQRGYEHAPGAID